MHWIYKADEKSDATPQRRAREWLSNLAELQQSGTSEEFLESVRVDLFPDKIYVFTPKGDIMPLPKGATTVDFAYAVHTDIGNRTVAAKINRGLVPLRTPLQNGQTVEIIASRGAKPNPTWLTFVRSAKARTAIRNHMKNLRSTESVDLGKRLLDKSLKDIGSSLRKVGKVRMGEALEELGLSSAEDLYEQLGLGERGRFLLLRRLLLRLLLLLHLLLGRGCWLLLRVDVDFDLELDGRRRRRGENGDVLPDLVRRGRARRAGVVVGERRAVRRAEVVRRRRLGELCVETERERVCKRDRETVYVRASACMCESEGECVCA